MDEHDATMSEPDSPRSSTCRAPSGRRAQPRPRYGDRGADRVRQPGQDLQGRRPRGRRPAGPRPARRDRASSSRSSARRASGKSTLMNILGGLDVPSAGRAVVAGHDSAEMGRRERTRYRRQVIGFVWQQTARNLLPYLTALENVELPMMLDGVGRPDARAPRAASCSARSAWPTAPTIGRTGCRAASSSASRSPWRWPTAGGAARRRADRRARHGDGARDLRALPPAQPASSA